MGAHRDMDPELSAAFSLPPPHHQVARSQGKGIFLFRRLKDIMDWRKGTAGKKLTGVETQPARANMNPSGSHVSRSEEGPERRGLAAQVGATAGQERALT